jgi:WD40 repeat protein
MNSSDKKAKPVKTDDYSKNKNYFKELIGGHSGAVFKSKFTHDSKYLLSCGSDGLACLWDLGRLDIQIGEENTQESEINSDEKFESKIRSSFFEPYFSESSLACSYSGHLYPCWDIEIFSRLNLFSTSSKDATAKLWSFDRLYPLRVYCGHQSDVNCVKFHPNGSYLATGSSDKTVRLWSVQTSEFVRLFSGHRSRVFAVAFSPDGNYLASAGEDRKIKIWDLRSGGLFKEFKGHSDIVHALEFDNNSEVLCSGGLDKTVKFWDFHQKNISIEADLLKNDLNSSKNSSKYSNSSSSSNELIRSFNVDFNVYSIGCDVQNVFYFTGARKPNKSVLNLENLNLSGTTESSILNTSTKQIKNEPAPKVVNPPSNPVQSKVLVNPTKTKTPKFSKASASATAQVQPSTSASSSGSITMPVAPSTSKSTINTRRRTALQAQHANPTPTPTPQTPNTSAYLFSNNDDLYEC